MSNYVYGPVVCPSCGFPIGGAIQDKFNEERAKLYQMNNSKDTDMASSDESIISGINSFSNETIETGNILTNICKVTNLCCRMHLITSVQQPR